MDDVNGYVVLHAKNEDISHGSGVGAPPCIVKDSRLPFGTMPSRVTGRLGLRCPELNHLGIYSPWN